MLMPELHDKMAKQGADMLVNCLKDLPRYYENVGNKQIWKLHMVSTLKGHFWNLTIVSCTNEFYMFKNFTDYLLAAPKITKDFTVIRWTTMSAKEVLNLYRSLYSFKPLLTTFNTDPVKIIELDIDINSSDKENCNLSPAGTIEYSKLENCLKVTCADHKGQRVRIFKLSMSKKKVMSAMEF
jgi:methionyl-tRNA formyltransferase